MTHIFTLDYGYSVGYPHHADHSGQPCEIVRTLDDRNRDVEVGTVHVVRFADGVKLTAWADELRAIDGV